MICWIFFRHWEIYSTSMTGSLPTTIFGTRKTARRKCAGARWQWTGLLMDGTELTAHLSAGYVHFILGGVLSAVPKGTQPSEVWNYEPYWEIENFGSPEYCFQTPLTQLELICYDGYAWVLICKPDFSKQVKRTFPMAKTPEEFYSQH